MKTTNENPTIEPSGLLCYELQYVDKETRTEIAKWKHALGIHLNVGGGNEYVLFLRCPRLTVNNFRSMWERGEQLIRQTFKVNLDYSEYAKSVDRVLHISYDPDAYFNEYAEPVFASEERPQILNY